MICNEDLVISLIIMKIWITFNLWNHVLEEAKQIRRLITESELTFSITKRLLSKIIIWKGYLLQCTHGTENDDEIYFETEIEAYWTRIYCQNVLCLRNTFDYKFQTENDYLTKLNFGVEVTSYESRCVLCLEWKTNFGRLVLRRTMFSEHGFIRYYILNNS